MTTTDLRFVLPSLAVFPGADEGLLVVGLSARLIKLGSVAVVSSDDFARLVMKELGMSDCCIEDRLIVSHGGLPLCSH